MNLIRNMIQIKPGSLVFENIFNILHEIHEKGKSDCWNDNEIKCNCSYCEGKTKLHYGLNIPECKKWNSWWVIKYWDKRYIRWTNSFLKFI